VSVKVQWGVAKYSKDSHIAVAGRRVADCFFIIRHGKVKIAKEVVIDGDKDEVLVPGDFFGVAAAMSSYSHIETAIALTDVTLITVRPQQYVPLIQNNTQVATKILMQLSNRLRFLNDALTKLTLKSDAKNVDGDPSRLFDVAEYYFRQKQYDQAFYAYTQYVKYCPDGKHREAVAGLLARLKERVGDVKTGIAKGELIHAYKKGDMIFAEGELGDEFFVVQTGSVKISKIIDNKEVLLGMLGEGDVFGEMAILEGKPRGASAVANEDSTVMAASKSNFEFLIENQPQLISKITTLLAKRIWSTFKQLEVIHITNPLGRVYGILLVQLEKGRLNLESPEPHLFGAKWDELVNMLGLAEKEGYILMGKLQEDNNLQVKDGRVHAYSIREVAVQAALYRKIDAREKTKREHWSKAQS